MWVSDRHLRLSVGEDTSLAVQHAVIAAWKRLWDARGEAERGLLGLRDITPAYHTLVLAFDPRALDHEAARAAVLAMLATGFAEWEATPGRTVEIPACYEGDFAPDLADIAHHAGLTIDETVARHSGAEYLVRFIGFAPGFPYLGGLPPELAMPRLQRPRTRVPAGSIGIAGEQAGIYPHATPGGWRLIARTPMRLFDAHRTLSGGPPCVLSPGDRVRLVPISAARFEDLSAAGERGTA